MIKANRLLLGLICCGLILTFSTGCVSEVDPNKALAKANDSNIKRLSNLYFSFQMKNDWKGPKDEKEFKDFLNKLSPTKLERIGIDPSTVDQLFVNERDGEPFKIRYSVPGSAMGSSEAVVFEATGVDGKRMVGFLNMAVREVDESEYESLWSGKIKAADPDRT